MFLAGKKNSSIIHCTCSKVTDEKYRQSVCSAFVISLLTFLYFSTIVSLFGAGAVLFFTAPAPAPAPTKMCRLRRLRLRIPGYVMILIRPNYVLFKLLQVPFPLNVRGGRESFISVRELKTQTCPVTRRPVISSVRSGGSGTASCHSARVR